MYHVLEGCLALSVLRRGRLLVEDDQAVDLIQLVTLNRRGSLVGLLTLERVATGAVTVDVGHVL